MYSPHRQNEGAKEPQKGTPRVKRSAPLFRWVALESEASCRLHSWLTSSEAAIRIGGGVNRECRIAGCVAHGFLSQKIRIVVRATILRLPVGSWKFNGIVTDLIDAADKVCTLVQDHSCLALWTKSGIPRAERDPIVDGVTPPLVKYCTLRSHEVSQTALNVS